MEVEVTPMNVPPDSSPSLPLQTKQKLEFGSEELPPHRSSSDEVTNHKKFVPFSSTPKFITLGSLYNSREGLPSELDPGTSKGPSNWYSRAMDGGHRVLPRGKLEVQLNPKGAGLRRHLPFRRPLSFKHKRREPSHAGEYWAGQNKTDLTDLERIILNKTPGIVIDYPNASGEDKFMGIFAPHSAYLPGKAKRPMKNRPGKRRQNKRKQNSRPQSPPSLPHYHEAPRRPSKPPVDYEIPLVSLQMSSEQYLPSKVGNTKGVHSQKVYETKGIDAHGIPSRSQTHPQKPKASYPSTNPLQKTQTKDYEAPTKDTSHQSQITPAKSHQPPSKRYEHPATNYKTPKREKTKSSYPIVTSDPKVEGYPKRAKGQVPPWLMTLKRGKDNPTPPTSAYFPEASTVKWIPMDSIRDVGPVHIKPKDKYTSLRAISLNSKDYTSTPTKKKSKDVYKPPASDYKTLSKAHENPLDDSTIKEYLPPDSVYPVPASVTPSTKTKNEYDDSHSSTERGYVLPTAHQKEYLTTYSPVTYASVTSKTAHKKLNSSTSLKSRRPPIIIINEDDDYYDYDYVDDDYYYDDSEDDYYYDDDYIDYYDDDYVYEVVTRGQRPFMPHIVMANLEDILYELDIMEYGYILGIPGTSRGRGRQHLELHL